MRIEALERGLPPATLLLGPDLEQMVRAAVRALRGSGLLAADRIICRHVSAAGARGIVRFAQTAPFGPFKAVIAVLDGAAPQAQNILLKVLEEPRGTARFILAATERPLPTIVSRCRVIHVPGAGGRQDADGTAGRAVAAAVQSARSGDLRGLDQALKGWDGARHAVLFSRLAESASGCGPLDLGKDQARRLLRALSRFGGASDRLAAHAALAAALGDRDRHD